ncbi:MAG: hypothetical protein H6934_08245 [Burkholderiaceae bacterium]|nr:hypothetical protein [Burkholderiaceae bacterium]
MLKKKSSGPTVGRPSQRSRELFFMASHDIDRFRALVASEPFSRLIKLDEGSAEDRRRRQMERTARLEREAAERMARDEGGYE